MSTAACKTALAALEAAISPLPIRADGTKAPALVSWKWLQSRRPTPSQVERWFAQTPEAGVAVLGGHVSNGLEFIDFDEHVIFEAFQQRAVEHGLGELVERVGNGWRELSPNGAHLAYRCATIRGNTKLAQRPKHPEEIVDPNDRVKTLIETRGEGGYLIVAPSGGGVHPSGRPYGPMMGSFATIVTITPQEREALFELCRTFDEMPRPVYGGISTTRTALAAGERPGDAFNAHANWDDILSPHGWTVLFSKGGLTYWRRPGKTDPGWSATTGVRGADGIDVLYVFSTATAFGAERGYSKFGAYAALEHGGDFSAAAKALAGQGYGAPPVRIADASERNGSGASPNGSGAYAATAVDVDDWPEPADIDGPGPAPELPLDCFPGLLVDHAEDIAYRMQCPIDYVVWTLLVTLSTVIGRSVGIRPKRLDDWSERPALWVALIGDPSSMKTPGMSGGVRLLHALNHHLRAEYHAEMEAWREQCADAKRADPKRPDLPAEPQLRWLVVDDATTEKMAMLLQPSISRGLVFVRDEVAGLIRELERYRSRAGDREFMLQSYSGGPKSVARISRPPVFVPDLLLNIVGGVQPDVAREIFAGGADDGLGERFLCIWPELPSIFIDVDRFPDKNKRDAFDEVAKRLYVADWATLLHTDDFSAVPFCRVSHEAHEVFSEWRARTVQSTRGESPRYEHRFGRRVGKYPGVAARIALVMHLFDSVAREHASDARQALGSVDSRLVARVTHLMDNYVLPMEQRVYQAYAVAPEAEGARRIARWIRQARPTRFTARSIRRHGWANLDSQIAVGAALEWLCSRDWLREANPEKRSGRPSEIFLVNPRIWERS